MRTADFTIDLGAKRVLRAAAPAGRVGDPGEPDGPGEQPDGAGEQVEVRLTPTEWHLVEVLVRHRGKLVTSRQLLQEVWGPQYGDETHYLRVYLAQIRRKLEPEPARPRYFLTEAGMGYRFEPGG